MFLRRYERRAKGGRRHVLTEAEWAFRIAKDELEIRPIWHQKEDRVRAHIPVCFLAYVLEGVFDC